MIKAENIPDEVYDAVGIPKWQAQAYLLAMLNAWPGATVNTHCDNMGEYNAAHLPLSQENRKDDL
jgi:hypothetical protein